MSYRTPQIFEAVQTPYHGRLARGLPVLREPRAQAIPPYFFIRTARLQILTRTANCLLAALLLAAPAARAQLTGPADPPARMEAAPDALKNISLNEHLNTQLPLDASF